MTEDFCLEGLFGFTKHSAVTSAVENIDQSVVTRRSLHL